MPKPILLLITLLSAIPIFGESQNLSGIINAYAQVEDIEYCSASLTVSNTAGFEVSQDIILIQMQGAQINDNNSSAFGAVTDIRKAGLFERATITSVNNNTIQLQHELVNEYEPNQGLQIVSFPSFENANVEALLEAQQWDGSTGGILALEVTNQLSLNANIDLTGAGFKGGVIQRLESDCSFINVQTNYSYSLNNWRAAQKGSAIQPVPNEKASGKGAWANGGGGGNDHNSGGGGGSNISQGGLGGVYNSGTTFGCRGNHPGIGGRALPQENNRLYLGGGGGAGHADDVGGGTGGANGGGIIILIAKNIVGNGQSIIANGAGALDATGEGAGGGGGAGSILLKTETITGDLNIEVRGGKGGNASGNSSRCFGPGGGGGGGLIISNNNLTSTNNLLTAGAAGTIQGSLSECDNETNGATAGEGGLQIFSENLILKGNTEIVVPSIVQSSENPKVCSESDVQFTAEVIGTGISFQWQMDSGNGFEDLANNNTFTGVNAPTLSIKNIQEEMQDNLFRLIVTSECFDDLISEDIGFIWIENPNANFDFIIGEDEVQFNNLSSNFDSVHWSFGDGTFSNEINPIHTYPNNQNYIVTLTIFNECGQSNISQGIPLLSAPIALIHAENTSGCVPFEVNFSSEQSTNAEDVVWNFPGGNPASSSQQNPIISYSSSGTYDVQLIAINNQGRDTSYLENYIFVEAAPIADFTFVKNNNTVQFQNLSANATSYLWDFGNGNQSMETDPQHEFAAGGNYTVTLSAINDCGIIKMSKDISTVALPTAVIGSSQAKSCIPHTIQFTSQESEAVENVEWHFEGG